MPQLSVTLVRLKRPAHEPRANAVCLEIRSQRCLSSDRQHAGTCAAGGPTEMCTLSSVDLGSEGITCRST